MNDHQREMFFMLLEVDKICKTNKIQYQLFAGTALGAVRHKGFVPWDDDLDIIMPREDYERFLIAAEQMLNPDTYYLQKEFSAHWPMFYSKIRKNKTACIERYIPKDDKIHQGIFIDIFPFDNLYETSILRKMQFYASKIVIAKSLFARGYLTDSPKKRLFLQLCRLLPRKTLLMFAQNRSHTSTSHVHSFFSAGSRYEKNIFPRSWLTENVELLFETEMFPVSSHYHEMLQRLYGDYMTPTPESERKYKVHGEIVDTNHSYEDYLGIQKELRFKNYSRSIR